MSTEDHKNGPEHEGNGDHDSVTEPISTPDRLSGERADPQELKHIRPFVEPFHPLMEHEKETDDLRDLCLTGLHMLCKHDDLVAALERLRYADTSEGLPAESESEIEQARRRAELARKEVANDFPLLHAHFLMGLWGALEAWVLNLVRTWMKLRPDDVPKEEIKQMKVSSQDFLVLDLEERLDRVLSELTGRGHGSGSTFFESLLKTVGLDGPMEPEVKDRLFEFHQVRNVYAHRGGIADQHLLNQCPWLGVQVGERVSIGSHRYSDYKLAVHSCMDTVLNRCLARFHIWRDSNNEFRWL